MRTLITALLCSLMIASGEDLPRYYGIRDPGCAEALRIGSSADIRGSFDTKGNFDIGIGELRDGSRDPIVFTHKQLAYFWSTLAKDKFVCLTLEKNTMEADERAKYVQSIADALLSCGVSRVRIHQAYGGGVEVVFDESKEPSKKQK